MTAPPKHRQVYTAIQRDIHSGRLSTGRGCRARQSLVGVSASRASRSAARCATSRWPDGRPPGRRRDLRRRRPAKALGQSFGLLIPDLGETEIFEPICQGMMASPLAHDHALLWGSTTGQCGARPIATPGSCASSTSSAASPACSSRRSSIGAAKDAINARIAHALDAARHPVVLLDRPVSPYPDAAATTISSASTIGGPATHHRASAPPRLPPHRLRRAAAGRRHCRCPRGRLPGGALRVGGAGRAASLDRRLDASDGAAVAALVDDSASPTAWSAPTTAPQAW